MDKVTQVYDRLAAVRVKGAAIDSRTFKAKVADRLVRLAYRLDPNRPQVVSAPTGGAYRIEVGGVTLANVSTGSVMQTRPAR